MKDNIKKLLIKKGVSVRDAMKQMGEGAEKILFVVDDDGRLLGALTDGDIRIWILADKALKDSIDKVFNKKPVYVDDACPIDTVKGMMIDQKLESIPVVDASRRVVDVHLWEVIFGEGNRMQKLKISIPVVIMAGGKGARLDPFTRILPKPLFPIGEKPVVEIIMDNFFNSGCDEFHLVLGYKGDMIRSYFDNISLPYKIKYVHEKEALGTAGGLKLLHREMAKTFFVSNCDIIIKADYREVYDFHLKNKCQITLVGSMNHFKIPYGVLKIDEGGELNDIDEKPEYDLLVNTGMYVVEKDVLAMIPKDKYFDFTDLIKRVKKKNGKVGVFPVSEKSWLDVGQWEAYKETVKKIGV